jgi:hypothetical protein
MSTSPAELTPETTERHLHRATQVVLIMGLALALLCLAVRLQMKFHLIGTLNQEDSKFATVVVLAMVPVQT